MCRSKDDGGRRCPKHTPRGRRLDRATTRAATAQQAVQIFIGTTPFRQDESPSMMAMSRRPSYYDTDEWVEFDDSIRTTAERHGIEIIDQNHASGIWQGQTEPAGAYNVRGATIDDVRHWASEVAGRYDQDSVMIGEHDPDGNGRIYTFNVDENDAPTAIEALRNAGIPGARLYDGTLEIANQNGRLSHHQERALKSAFGEANISAANIEFVEMKGNRSPGPDQDEHLKRTPIKQIQMLRQNYADTHGIPPRAPLPHLTETDDIAAAHQYDIGEHQPTHPKIQRSYRSFRQHIRQQWNALAAAGYRFEPWSGTDAHGEQQEQPYANSAEMVTDLRDNKHLYYFRTEASGGLPPDHPMAKEITVTMPDGTPTKLVANDVFRAVHDSIAHSEGHQFGPHGEKCAWWTHRASLPSEARLALWNETRAQNAWTNAGPHMITTTPDGTPRTLKRGDSGWLPQTQRPYSDQKCVLPEDPEAFI